MSWLFSQALVEGFSRDTCSDGSPSAQLSVMPTPHKFWRNDKTMEASDLSRFGLTCRLLTEDHGAALLTWYLAGSRARTSALPEKAQASRAQGQACGPTWRASLARFDPISCGWKTVQLSLLGGSELSSVIWPRSGMTADGQCWELPTLEHRTSVTDSGFWPTPVASDTSSRKKPYAQGGTPLSLAVKWPTPTVCGNHNRKGASATSGDGLATAVKKFPTPTAGTDCLGAWGGSNARAQMKKLVSGSELYGPLNPMWVEWLMGWPIGWTDLKPLGTVKYPSAQLKHSDCFQANSEAIA